MKLNTNEALAVTHLTVSYDRIPVLEDVTFTVNQGTLVGIVGPNGAGKSTLLKSIVGLLPLRQGSITIFGSSFAQERKRVAYVPQKSSVDWDFPITVFDVALMGCYGNLGWFKRPGAHEKTLTWQALAHVGMTAYADRPIGSLSGGQQQRVFLARALVQDPDLYIMDEPFAGVDSVTEQIMITLLKSLCSQGKTVIVVHHDLQSLEHYFDALVVLNKQVVAVGAAQDIIKKNMLTIAYGQRVARFYHNRHE